MRVEKNKRRKQMYQAHKHIAKNLRLLRYIKGLSQEQTAQMLHMSRSCYCHLESGSKVPDLITVYQISRFFDISLDYLLTFDITEHLLSLLKRDNNHLEAHHFMEKYLQLSHGAKQQIRSRIDLLIDEEEEYNLFPWDYSKSEVKQWK